MDYRDDIVDLGVASIETRGAGGPFVEDVIGKLTPGLSDDD